MKSSENKNHSLAASIHIIEKKYNKVFTDYDELAVKLKELGIEITGKEIYDFEDNYYSTIEKEDRELILKNMLS